MSKRRKRHGGSGGVVFLSERSGASVTEGGSRGPRGSSPAGADRRFSAPGTEVAPIDRRAMVPIPADALGALTSEMSRFNRMMEDLFSREHPGRSPEERKEMWVLLSALTVVVVFCFVAFYLNQSEVREMHTGLQAEIEHAGKSATSSMERALAGLRLDRLPEANAALERFLKEKDRRDGQRIGELQDAFKGLMEKAGSGAREEFKDIEGELKALRRLSEEIRMAQAQAPVAAVPAPPAPPAAPTEIALKGTETRTGWAARAPDGAPGREPPVPAARSSSPSTDAPGPPSGGGPGEPR